jgi:hypothetical protein
MPTLVVVKDILLACRNKPIIMKCDEDITQGDDKQNASYAADTNEETDFDTEWKFSKRYLPQE